MQIWMFILVLFASSFVHAKKISPKSYVMCRNAKIVRTIRVDWDSGLEQCNTIYTKAGKDRVIGEGKFLESCVGFSTNVQANLEKAGWNCKNMATVTLSTSSE
ncbi:MAG: hypothetical protein AB8E15_11715 [Bdellovibrionales bacterium]